MRIPKRIKMLKTVVSDFPLAPRLFAKKGAYHLVETNRHGAVSAILTDFDCQLLGLKPGEFEVIEWRE